MKRLTFIFVLLIALVSPALWHGQAQTAPADYYDIVQKVYIGYYQRPADPKGLLWWAERLDAVGGNLNGIIESFANSAESQVLWGTVDSSNVDTVVDSIYMALFNRVAEVEGKTYWVNAFSKGEVTKAAMMLAILNGARNQDLQTINNRLAAANLFTKAIDPELDGRDFLCNYSGNGDAARGRNFISGVTSDPVTIPTKPMLFCCPPVPISYAYTMLLPEGWTSATATGINNSGQVVGYGEDPSGQYRGFLYSNGAYTMLLPEGWTSATATGINNSGQVVGYGSYSSVFRYANNAYTALRVEGAYKTTGINDNGEVVGYSIHASEQGTFTGVPAPLLLGFLFGGGPYTTLLPEGWLSSVAMGINNRGQVVGYGYDASGPQYKGFLYSGSLYTTLLPPGWWSASATGINESGQVVGYGEDAPGQYLGFLYSEGAFSTLLPEGWTSSQAKAINNGGQVVGYGYNAAGQQKIFVYNKGTYTTLPPPQDTRLEDAAGINDSGQVVGYGYVSERLQGFIATPARVVTEADNGQTLSVRPGSLLQIQLRGPGATGYGWYVDTYNHGALELVSYNAYPDTGDAGAPLTEVYVFKPLTLGATDLSLAYYRPWEGIDQSTKRFSVAVEVD